MVLGTAFVQSILGDSACRGDVPGLDAKHDFRASENTTK